MSDYYYYYYYSFLFLIALLLPPLPIYGGECRLPKLAMVILATRLSFPSSSSLLLSLLSSLSSLLLSVQDCHRLRCICLDVQVLSSSCYL